MMQHSKLLFSSRLMVASFLTLSLTMGLTMNSAFAAESKVVIGSLVSGQVSKLYVKAGDKVTKGQKLLNLDSARYHAKMSLLKAQQKMAKLTMDDARIELDQALDLFDRTVTSKRTLDASQLRFDVAQAAFAKAKAEVSFHQAWSKYVFIKAPIHGEISKVYTPVGTTVFKENTPMIEITP